VMTTPQLLTVGVGAATLSRRTWGPAPMWDQRLGGGVMLAIAELVGLPLLGVVLVGWIRADDAEARLVDAELDARRTAPRPPTPGFRARCSSTICAATSPSATGARRTR